MNPTTTKINLHNDTPPVGVLPASCWLTLLPSPWRWDVITRRCCQGCCQRCCQLMSSISMFLILSLFCVFSSWFSLHFFLLILEFDECVVLSWIAFVLVFCVFLTDWDSNDGIVLSVCLFCWHECFFSLFVPFLGSTSNDFPSIFSPNDNIDLNWTEKKFFLKHSTKDEKIKIRLFFRYP